MYAQTYNVIDSVAASGADISLLGHILQITGAPAIDYRKIEVEQSLQALNELLTVATVTPTAVASTDYSLTISQYTPSGLITRTFLYTTAASGDTATTIADAFRAAINLETALDVAATGTTTLIITALTGSPLFTVKLGSNLSNAYTVYGKTAFTGGTVVAATGVFTKTAHGFVVGDSMTVTASTTSTYTLNGVTVTVPFTTVVLTTPDADTFTLRGLKVTTNGTGIGASAFAQAARGSGASLISRFPNVTSANTYCQYIFTFTSNQMALGTSNAEQQARQHIVFVNQGDSDWAGSGGFDSVLTYKLQAVTAAGGTTAEAKTVAVIG